MRRRGEGSVGFFTRSSSGARCSGPLRGRTALAGEVNRLKRDLASVLRTMQGRTEDGAINQRTAEWGRARCAKLPWRPTSFWNCRLHRRRAISALARIDTEIEAKALLETVPVYRPLPHFRGSNWLRWRHPPDHPCIQCFRSGGAG